MVSLVRLLERSFLALTSSLTLAVSCSGSEFESTADGGSVPTDAATGGALSSGGSVSSTGGRSGGTGGTGASSTGGSQMGGSGGFAGMSTGGRPTTGGAGGMGMTGGAGGVISTGGTGGMGMTGGMGGGGGSVGACAGSPSCSTCCAQDNLDGFYVFAEVMYDCACNEPCAGPCGAYCAAVVGEGSPSNECLLCMEQATGSLCPTVIDQLCKPIASCDAYLPCVFGCAE